MGTTTLRLLLYLLLFALAPTLAVAQQNIRYTATIHPLAAILEEVVGTRGEVKQLLPPGSSPHTFDPRPSDAVMLERSLALFYAGPNLDQEWTQELPAPRKIEMLQLVPREQRLTLGAHQHEHGGPEAAKDNHAGQSGPVDPHFWTDPLTVQAMLPALVATLSELDPAGRPAYERNGAAFADQLEQLNARVAALLAPAQGKPILLFHPSFQYLLNRYHLDLAGLIEPFPGREPSPKDLQRLIRKIKRLDARAIFTEPQLPERPARVVAETAHLTLYKLDPLGGTAGRQTYEELIMHNARVLHDALTSEQ